MGSLLRYIFHQRHQTNLQSLRESTLLILVEWGSFRFIFVDAIKESGGRATIILLANPPFPLAPISALSSPPSARAVQWQVPPRRSF